MPPSGTAIVYIGCKLPNGLILDLYPDPPKEQKDQLLQPTPQDPKQRVVLKGANDPSVRRDPNRAQGEHPYAVTAVDKSFWEAWLKQRGNSKLEFITKNLVFVAQDPEEAADKAKERMGEKTGLEALNMEADGRGLPKDPRLPRGGTETTQVTADADSMRAARGNQSVAA